MEEESNTQAKEAEPRGTDERRACLMKEEEELPQETPQQTKPCPSSISLFVLASAFCSGGLELMILLLQPPEC